jgi:hypothetical protein
MVVRHVLPHCQLLLEALQALQALKGKVKVKRVPNQPPCPGNFQSKWIVQTQVQLLVQLLVQVLVQLLVQMAGWALVFVAQPLDWQAQGIQVSSGLQLSRWPR